MRQGYWPHQCEEHVRQGRRWQKRYANLSSVQKHLEEAIPALWCFVTAHRQCAVTVSSAKLAKQAMQVLF